MSVVRKIRRALLDERGGANIYMLLAAFLPLSLVPFMWDIASIHYTRSMANTSADAAALAAAQGYAEMLQRTLDKNGIFLGDCVVHEFSPQQVLLRYLLEPGFSVPIDVGENQALALVQANGAELTSFDAGLDFDGARSLFGIPIPSIDIGLSTKRLANTAYGSLYQRPFDVASEAHTVVYLGSFNVWPRPCGDGATWDFELKWRVSLMSPTSLNSGDGGSPMIWCVPPTPIPSPTSTPSPAPTQVWKGPGPSPTPTFVPRPPPLPDPIIVSECQNH